MSFVIVMQLLHVSEYKSCRIGKEVPSLLAKVFSWSYCLLCSDIVYVINVVINNILMYFSFIHISDLII